MKRRPHAVLIRTLVISVVCAAGVLALLHFTDRTRPGVSPEVRETGTREFMEEGTVEWNGQKYRKKPALTVLLLGGIDRTGNGNSVRTNNYRNGGQADFLLLVAIDHGNRQIHQLQIDRDTMTEVMVLGVYGNETGTREMQVCLAHSFGARPEDNAKYTVRAVRTLLEGLEIDGYYMADYSIVSTVTDLLGGLAVTIPEDMTAVRPEWTEGRTVLLDGKEAETFVRTRQKTGQGTNEERMNRQAVFMKALTAALKKRLSEDPSFAAVLVPSAGANACTSLSEQRLLEEISGSCAYEVLPAERLPGEYVTAENGFVEFYCREGSTAAWIMEHLYSVQ